MHNKNETPLVSAASFCTFHVPHLEVLEQFLSQSVLELFQQSASSIRHCGCVGVAREKIKDESFSQRIARTKTKRL